MTKLYLEVRKDKYHHWARVFESWEKSVILEKFWEYQPQSYQRRIVDENGLVWVTSVSGKEHGLD